MTALEFQDLHPSHRASAWARLNERQQLKLMFGLMRLNVSMRIHNALLRLRLRL
jgi:hypothetical protein